MNMYAIFWKYLDDSWPVCESGNGNFCLTLEEAKDICAKMNFKYANRINHWYVFKPASKVENVSRVEDILEDPTN